VIRKILAVIAGYVVFALSSVLLFQLTSHNPHQDAPIAFKYVTIAYGVFFSVLSGFVLKLIANHRKLTLNFILAAVIFLLAIISMLTSAGNHWTQLFAMCIFAPASVFGGYLGNSFKGNNNKARIKWTGLCINILLRSNTNTVLINYLVALSSVKVFIIFVS
jgi:hypothetical protein